MTPLRLSFLLCKALIIIIESLERRFDDAVITEQERRRLFQQNSQLKRDLAELGEGFASDDEIRRERDHFESLLKQNGIDPFGLPSGDRKSISLLPIS